MLIVFEDIWCWWQLLVILAVRWHTASLHIHVNITFTLFNYCKLHTIEILWTFWSSDLSFFSGLASSF